MAGPFVELPPNLMREASVEWNIVGSVAAGGQTDAGSLPIGRLDGGGFWRASLNEIQFFDDDQVRAFRAFRMLAAGGSATIIVPRHEVLQPWPVSNGAQVTSYSGITFSDSMTFSDGSGWFQPVIDVANSGGAALRATSMNVTINYAAPSPSFRGGEPFSIEHAVTSHHLYEISSAFDNGDGTWRITFSPPLREAVTAGTKLNFDQPKCCMRLATQDAMAFKLATWPYLPQTITFIESNVSSGS